MIKNQILEAQFSNDPLQLQRIIILRELEPFGNMTKEEVIGLAKDGIISRELLNLKLNFMDYIRQFENENINIIEFGSETTFDNKIKTIKSKLKEYASRNE